MTLAHIFINAFAPRFDPIVHQGSQRKDVELGDTLSMNRVLIPKSANVRRQPGLDV